ncbi:MAG: DUF1289 domain-containing protein [Reyranellaceae bacterium]
MSTTPRPARAIPSPCANVCMLHPDSNLCIGCKRTVEEIARWTGYTDEERRRIMAELPTRSHEL